MKKRILSVALSAAMVLSSFATAFAATDYDGLKPLQTAETILDELNADAGVVDTVDSNIFDEAQHEAQLKVLQNANTNFTATFNSADWSEYADKVRKTEYAINYMKVLELAKTNDTIKNALKTKDEAYNTTGRGLKESFGMLKSYKSEMSEFMTTYKAEIEGQSSLSDEQIRSYVVDAIKPVFGMIFSSKGVGTTDNTEFEFNYSQWMNDDTNKKLLAILFGEALTKELAVQEGNEGIVYNVKEYVKSDAGLNFVKEQIASICVADKEDAINAAYDFIGNVLYNAYAGKNVQKDVQMLFGGNGEEGAFEIAMKLLDADYAVANVWLNLIISEYVQLNLVSGPLNTVSAASTAAAVDLYDDANVSFKTEGLDGYGIGETSLALRTGWFDVECYAEDTPDSKTYSKTNDVTYSDGQIKITKDSSKGETYNAYLVLYRDAVSADASTFIESYPVIVHNEAISTPSRGGGGGTSRYLVKYETNGGTAIASEYFAKGSTVELTKVPARDGYKFAGWYLDAALTQKADSVVMNSALTVYAAWTPDEVGEIPEMLNGDDHFAYVQGYPEGDVRPQANITRAETITILFRLLKDSVKESNITTENIFTDVTEDDWYNTAVSTLAALEIINGRTETEFVPNEYITRAEFATIFARFVDSGYVVEDEFTDVQNHWAEDYIHEAASYGWIKGYEDGTYKPENNITRAEAMTVINRVLHRIPETAEDLLDGMTEWSDNSDADAWYYLAVQEATNSHEYTRKNDINETWTKLTEGKDWTQYE